MTPIDPTPRRTVIELHRIDWQVIDDGVMGGLSRGRCRLEGGQLWFEGELSTARGGGFSSIRGRLPEPLEVSRLAAFGLLAEGDGRDYQLRLRDSQASDAVAFRATFRAGREASRFSFPVEDFQPVVRGRAVEVLPPFAQRTMRHVGFMLNSDQPGPFRLRVRALECTFREDRLA